MSDEFAELIARSKRTRHAVMVIGDSYLGPSGEHRSGPTSWMCTKCGRFFPDLDAFADASHEHDSN